MTRTIQTLSRPVVKNAENIPVGNAEDGHLGEILSLCDSLNNLYEKLSRLDYLLKRKIIENNLK